MVTILSLTASTKMTIFYLTLWLLQSVAIALTRCARDNYPTCGAHSIIAKECAAAMTVLQCYFMLATLAYYGTESLHFSVFIVFGSVAKCQNENAAGISKYMVTYPLP